LVLWFAEGSSSNIRFSSEVTFFEMKIRFYVLLFAFIAVKNDFIKHFLVGFLNVDANRVKPFDVTIFVIAHYHNLSVIRLLTHTILILLN